MRSTSASTSTLPNNCIWTGTTVWRSTSGNSARSTAPSTTPGMWPMPPSTTIASTMIDSVSENDSGETKPWKAANIAPDTPPKVAPIANASSLMLRVLMPIALAAISSSRIAIQARPRRESCRRMQTTMVMIASSRNR